MWVPFVCAGLLAFTAYRKWKSDVQPLLLISLLTFTLAVVLVAINGHSKELVFPTALVHASAAFASFHLALTERIRISWLFCACYTGMVFNHILTDYSVTEPTWYIVNNSLWVLSVLGINLHGVQRKARRSQTPAQI